MDKKVISQIIGLVIEAQELALKVGIKNLVQPGLVKEMIIAEALGHALIISKHGADACNAADSSIRYEYLSCLEGGTGQLDRVFKEPPDKRKKSLTRITRNQKIYFAVFYKDNQLKLKTIYELEPSKVLEETNRQLDQSSNPISHVGFSIKWAAKNGTSVSFHSGTE
jgi:hypothetical protein